LLSSLLWLFFCWYIVRCYLLSFPTRRSSDLLKHIAEVAVGIGDKLIIGAGLNCIVILQHNDSVGHPDSRKSVTYYYRCPAPGYRADILKQPGLHKGIQRTCRFVEQYNLSVVVERAGKC